MLDVSGSIGPAWPAVRDAARSFIDAFDKNGDRMALVTYSYGAKVLDPMPAGFGFDKDKLKADVPNSLPGGTTSMAEGLYRGWDEVRSVASGQQAGLRVIVLFTDGSGNVLPGFMDASGIAKGVFTADFPKVLPDPTNATTNTPAIQGLFQTETGAQSPSWSFTPPSWNSPNTSMNLQVPAELQRAHAPSQRRHPDLVPAAEQRAQGERGGAEHEARPAQLQHHSRQVPRRGVQHPQRRDQPHRDHRRRRPQRRHRRPPGSASSPSAWAAW